MSDPIIPISDIQPFDVDEFILENQEKLEVSTLINLRGQLRRPVFDVDTFLAENSDDLDKSLNETLLDVTENPSRFLFSLAQIDNEKGIVSGIDSVQSKFKIRFPNYRDSEGNDLDNIDFRSKESPWQIYNKFFQLSRKAKEAAKGDVPGLAGNIVLTVNPSDLKFYELIFLQELEKNKEKFAKRGVFEKLKLQFLRSVESVPANLLEFANNVWDSGDTINDAKKRSRGKLFSLSGEFEKMQKTFDVAMADGDKFIDDDSVIGWVVSKGRAAVRNAPYVAAGFSVPMTVGSFAGPAAIPFWVTQIAPSRMRQYKDVGFDDETAKGLALLTSIPEAFVEMWGRFLNIGRKTAATELARQAGKGVLTRFVGQLGRSGTREVFEEIAQDMIATSVEVLGRWTNENIPNPDAQFFLEKLRDLANNIPEITGGIFLLGAPGSMITTMNMNRQLKTFDPNQLNAMLSDKNFVLTPEGAAQFQRFNSVGAAKIAAKAVPSRKDIEEVFGDAVPWSRKERIALSKLLNDPNHDTSEFFPANNVDVSNPTLSGITQQDIDQLRGLGYADEDISNMDKSIVESVVDSGIVAQEFFSVSAEAIDGVLNQKTTENQRRTETLLKRAEQIRNTSQSAKKVLEEEKALLTRRQKLKKNLVVQARLASIAKLEKALDEAQGEGIPIRSFADLVNQTDITDQELLNRIQTSLQLSKVEDGMSNNVSQILDGVIELTSKQTQGLVDKGFTFSEILKMSRQEAREILADPFSPSVANIDAALSDVISQEDFRVLENSRPTIEQQQNQEAEDAQLNLDLNARDEVTTRVDVEEFVEGGINSGEITIQEATEEQPEGLFIRDPETGEEKPVQFAGIPMLPSFADKKAFFRWTKAKLAVGGLLPKEIFNSARFKDGEIQKKLNEAKLLIREFNKIAKEIYEGGAPNLEESALLNAALGGKWAQRHLIQSLTEGDTRSIFVEGHGINGEVISERIDLQGTQQITTQQQFTDIVRISMRTGLGRKSFVVEDINIDIDATDQGIEAITVVDPLIRPVIRKMRLRIDNLSRELVQSGIIEGDLVQKIDENIGFYLTRTYRVHRDPGWKDAVKKNHPGIVENAKGFLVRQNPDLTPDELTRLINELLTEEGPMGLLKGGALGAKDTSILMKQGEIAPEIRALWGEFEDPLANFVTSSTKMIHLVSNHRFLVAIREQGIREGWLAKFNRAGRQISPPVEGVDITQLDTVIAAPNSVAMAPINGLRTTEDMALAFRMGFDESLGQDRSMPFRAWVWANGFAKFSKTVLSPMTHIRNIQGNLFFMLMNGHWNLTKFSKPLGILVDAGIVDKLEPLGKFFPDVINNIFSMDKAAWQEQFNEYLELRIVADNARQGELKQVFDDALNRQDGLEEFTQTWATNPIRKAANFVTDIYRAEDDIFKIYGYENELARYTKRLKADPQWVIQEGVDAGKPTRALKERIANLVTDTYPTYSKIPQLFKDFRNLPIAPFISFTVETWRTTANSLIIAIEEIRTPELRGIGIQRLSGWISSLSTTSIGAFFLMRALGMSLKDDDDLRKHLPPWSRNHPVLWIGEDEKGNKQYIDLGFTDPHSIISGVGIRMLREALFGTGELDNIIGVGILEGLRPFMNEDIFATKVLDVVRNKKNASFFDAITGEGGPGQPVYNPQDPDRGWQMAAHALDALEPGFTDRLRKTFFNKNGNTDIHGNKRTTGQFFFNEFVAVKRQTVDIRQSMSFKARDFNNQMRDAASLYTRIQGKRGNPTAEDILNAYNKANTARRKIFDDFVGLVDGVRRQGIPEEELRQILEAQRGISKDLANQILNDEYIDLKITPAMEKRANKLGNPIPFEILSKFTDKQLISKIRVLGRRRPFKLRKGFGREDLLRRQAEFDKRFESTLKWFQDRNIKVEEVLQKGRGKVTFRVLNQAARNLRGD